MENSKKEFNFCFFYNKELNYFPFDKLDEDISKLSKEISCKIICHHIELNEIEEKAPKIANLDMITCEPKEAPYLPKLLSYFPKLTWVHSMFAGVDKFICLKEIGQNPQLTLTNARGAYSGPLAEYTILAMLHFNYNEPKYRECMDNKKWTKLTNIMIDKKTILIIGYGKNGVAIAKRVKPAFNMKVIGVVRTMRENIEGKEYTDELYGFDQMDKNVIGKADFILATLPQTQQSNNLFDKKFFEMMKKDAVFINIGRGTAVVEEDLINALNNNVIRGAVLDVCQHEPLDSTDKLYDVSKDKLFITNHSGDFTTSYIEQSYEPLLANIKEFILNGKLVTVVKKDLGY